MYTKNLISQSKAAEKSPKRRYFRLFKNQEGIAAVEFALVSIPLFILIMGIIEFSLIFFAGYILESATNISARVGRTQAFASTNGDPSQYIREQVQNSGIGGLIDPNQLVISVASFTNLQDVGDDLLSVAGFGNTGDVATYRVSYNWRVFTPILATLIGDGAGNYPIVAFATVRNEPI